MLSSRTTHYLPLGGIFQILTPKNTTCADNGEPPSDCDLDVVMSSTGKLTSSTQRFVDFAKAVNTFWLGHRKQTEANSAGGHGVGISFTHVVGTCTH